MAETNRIFRLFMKLACVVITWTVIWLDLACVECYWHVLACIGMRWASCLLALVCIGIRWLALAIVGLYWLEVACIGILAYCSYFITGNIVQSKHAYGFYGMHNETITTLISVKAPKCSSTHKSRTLDSSLFIISLFIANVSHGHEFERKSTQIM